MNPPLQPPQEATDIYSISDQVLADRLQFIEEIGFGNWGSVWACRPKPDPSSPSSSSPHAPINTKIAVKLVHRSKTPTTAARVRSLWNEMKVVKSLKHEPHPSIIPFYSFIITPSYALITMAFHPRLVPVEVAEHHAKPWFHSLLSGIEFLHKRGVVHNDIKPANILLSTESVPVLVDFGFAERYELGSTDAFHSNLSYGTPEYLSPERARGLPHDTRKSDVWSLGITFFEILIGRTPFEQSEGEQFSTKEDLEKYWSRTLRGKWIGSWKMSPSMERMLRRMISPNADLRYNASEAMADRYWSQTQGDSPLASHRKSASVSHSRGTSLADIPNGLPVWTGRSTKEESKAKQERTKIPVAVDKENIASPPGLAREKSRSASALVSALPRHKRSQSHSVTQPAEPRGVAQTRKEGRAPSLIATLSPIKHSPLSTNTAQALHNSVSRELRDRENVLQASTAVNGVSRAARKPLGPRKPSPPSSPAKKRPAKENRTQDENSPLVEKKEKNRRSRIFGDSSKANRSGENDSPREYKAESVSHRMRQWERERQRIREIEEIEERMREAEEERQRQREQEREEEEMRRDMERQYALEMELERQKAQEAEFEKMRQREVLRQAERERQKELELVREELERQRVEDVQMYHGYPRITIRRDSPSTPPTSHVPTPLSPLIEEPSMFYDIEERSGNDTGLSLLKQSLRMSIDMTKRIYKSSTQALGYSKSSREQTPEEDLSRQSVSDRASWEDENIIREAKSSLPVVRHAVRNEQVAAANQLDRMTIWIKNVEQVVEDARQNFAMSTNAPLPPLPVAPISRRTSEQRPENRSNNSNHSARVPRRILAANHIFSQDYEPGQGETTATSLNVSVNEQPNESVEFRRSWMNNDASIPSIPSEDPSRMITHVKLSDGPGTPSRQRRRATILSRSPEAPAKTKPALQLDLSPSKGREKSRSQNDLQLGRPITPVTRLEFEIEQLSKPQPVPRLSTLVDPSIFISDSSGLRSPGCTSFGEKLKVDELTASPQHVEPYPPRPPSKTSTTIDTPAKRHLEGVYDRFLMSTTGVKRVGRGYQSETSGPISHIPQPKASVRRNPNFFLSTRKPMPPPVSSDDLRRTSSFDEFGVGPGPLGGAAPSKDEEGGHSVGIVRRALKAMSVKRL
ncbi:hypothetical protein BDW22DRAFT_1362161 [Trametopsis cervina]|nr:hypothetical protein BDW22DRAFT_1362161 [Trametopsis cervina]